MMELRENPLAGQYTISTGENFIYDMFNYGENPLAGQYTISTQVGNYEFRSNYRVKIPLRVNIPFLQKDDIF